jgi:hypothetical protein
MTENPSNDHEIQNPGPDRSGKPGTGPNVPAAKKKTIVTRTISAPLLVERVTALRSQSNAGRPPQPKSARRRLSITDIHSKDPEIPYVKFEAATKDLVCSLMERQDRMNEEIFLRINDIAYRLEDLEQDLTGNRRGK